MEKIDTLKFNEEFVWPPIPGIEATAAQMRAIAQTDKSKEHAWVVSVASGKVLWKSDEAGNCADKSNVSVHDAMDKGLVQGNLILHSHPGVPAELSLPDLECIFGADAWGNMCVSYDGTVAWSRGMVEGLKSSFGLMLWLHEIREKVITLARRDTGTSDWSDDRFTTADWVRDNFAVVDRLRRANLLTDYHVRYGDDAAAALRGEA